MTLHTEVSIAQIGHTFIHLHNQKFDYGDLQPDARITDYLNSPRKLYPDARGVFDDRTIEVEGYVVGRWEKLPFEIVAELKSYVGTCVPVIGYLIKGDMPRGCKCACTACPSGLCKDQEIIWFESQAWIEEIQSDSVDGKTWTEITIEFTLTQNWRPLNIYLWHWETDSGRVRPEGICATEPKEPYHCHVKCPPRIDEMASILSGKKCPDHRFVYQQYSDDVLRELYYDPLWWGSVTASCHCKGFTCPETDTCFYVDLRATQIVTRGELGLWNGIPISVFRLRYLPNTGTITFIITLQGHPRNETRTVTIDFDQMALDLQEQGLLTPSAYRLIIGDVDVYQNGIHYRPAFLEDVDGNLIEGFHPEIQYSGHFPLQVFGGWSTIGATYDGDYNTFDTEMAYTHIYTRI